MSNDVVDVLAKSVALNAELFKVSRDFYRWFNKSYQCPSSHPDHPYNKMGELLFTIENPVNGG